MKAQKSNNPDAYATPDQVDNRTPMQHIMRIPVIVAALGYLVDMYDLFLFTIVRVDSLTDIGMTEEQIFSQGRQTL